jgi:serine/threonine protein kinase
VLQDTPLNDEQTEYVLQKLVSEVDNLGDRPDEKLARMQVRFKRVRKFLDYLEANGTAYIVMELLSGETLEDRITKNGKLSSEEVDRILWPLLDGLEQVHNAGFLHRDIKPANIILGAQDKASLIDFGAARVAIADRTKTMTAIFTPGYAAPEQFSSAKQGPWTDIYGLAATLYYAITGKAPPSAFDRLMTDSYAPLSTSKPEGFSRGILAGIDAGLSLHVEQRPHSIAGWRALLREEPIDSEETQVMAVTTPPAPTLITPPTPPTPPTLPRMSATCATAPRARGPTGATWIALAVAAVLATMAGAYYAFAPRLVPVAAPAEPVAAKPATAVTAAPPAIATTQPEREPAKPAPQPPSAEAEEMVLKLTAADRQRIQVALTALGFDTRGTDGAFGPRSREMIAAWQRSRKRPVTGYLTAADNQALREAPQTPSRPAPPPEEETAASLAPPPQPVELAPAAPPPVPVTTYAGSLSGFATGGGSPSLAPVEADLRLVDRTLTGRLVHAVCGTLPIALAVGPGENVC